MNTGNENADQLTEEPISPSAHSSEALSLSTLDKIKRFFFSKEEWEAYLIEKLNEEKSRKDGITSSAKVSDDTAHKSVLLWIKTVFPSQDDANRFLNAQLEKLQSEKTDKTNQSLKSSK